MTKLVRRTCLVVALLERRRQSTFHPNVAPPAAYKQWRRRGRVYWVAAGKPPTA